MPNPWRFELHAEVIVLVCFLAGALMFNLPGSWREQVRVALTRIERPIYLVFLVVAGAMWEITAWQGWLLLVLFVAGRLAGKTIGVFLSREERLGKQLSLGLGLGQLSNEEQIRIALAPMGSLAIAIVVSAQDLYSGATVSWMVTTRSPARSTKMSAAATCSSSSRPVRR